MFSCSVHYFLQFLQFSNPKQGSKYICFNNYKCTLIVNICFTCNFLFNICFLNIRFKRNMSKYMRFLKEKKHLQLNLNSGLCFHDNFSYIQSFISYKLCCYIGGYRILRATINKSLLLILCSILFQFNIENIVGLKLVNN